MLSVVYKLKDIAFEALMGIYIEGNKENGAELYPTVSENEQIIRAEQDFYAFLQAFFRNDRAFYAMWACEGRYVSALRMEPYQDGYLLEALETAPDARCKGYAKALVTDVLSYLRKKTNAPIYSHVNKKNKASLVVHNACGLKKILEHAVYIDGSVSHHCCTLRY